MDKQAIRQMVWDRLTEARQAAFPLPVHGRIPNFVGAAAAAARLRELPEWRRARAVKVNPDAPQHPVRLAAILDGKVLYMPTPRLRAGFLCLRPEWVPPGKERYATSIKGMAAFGREVVLEEVEPIDLVVAGSVAVDPLGGRIGKGEGYSDREYAILRELGHPEMPIVTTVHELQVLDRVPVDPHDIPVDIICTPERVIRTHTRYPRPQGIDWSRVTDGELQAMPPLRQLLERRLRPR
ncbi:MAG: 5-formyltetrahydrofolate cyclo-ligase [Bacillota bacterium]|nr:MAG: 5-formyltetrahydrofolate cyclo-ligase [Bacillota bacterium]